VIAEIIGMAEETSHDLIRFPTRPVSQMPLHLEQKLRSRFSVETIQALRQTIEPTS